MRLIWHRNWLFYISGETRENLDAISKRVKWILRGDLDYYSVHGAVGELEEEEHFKDAAEVFLLCT